MGAPPKTAQCGDSIDSLLASRRDATMKLFGKNQSYITKERFYIIHYFSFPLAKPQPFSPIFFTTRAIHPTNTSSNPSPPTSAHLRSSSLSAERGRCVADSVPPPASPLHRPAPCSLASWQTTDTTPGGSRRGCGGGLACRRYGTTRGRAPQDCSSYRHAPRG